MSTAPASGPAGCLRQLAPSGRRENRMKGGSGGGERPDGRQREKKQSRRTFLLETADDIEVKTLEDIIAFNKKKGNCLACHDIKGGKLPGNIGPPLIAISARFSKEDLKNQITDARVKNPNTIMPPFGPHQVLKAEEIDHVVEFIYTL